MPLSRRQFVWLSLPWVSPLGCHNRDSQARKTTVTPSISPERLHAVHSHREQFRRGQDARMRGPHSPLARVDYQHIPIGDFVVGVDSAAPLHLPAELRTAFGGKLTVSRLGTVVSFSSTETVLMNGQPTQSGELHKGDTIQLGPTRLLLTGSPDDPGFGIYSDSAEAKLKYSGLHYFPEDDSFVVQGKLLRSPPHKVKVMASRGEPQELVSVGDLQFSLPSGGDRVACTLEAYLETPSGTTLFLIFRDQTSGKPDGSYGAGRFLLAELDADDSAILDFNQAWNPLCAYSPYFHCPMPSRKNHLPVAVKAGEKSYGEH